MKTIQFEKLIQAITGRPLTLRTSTLSEEIPLSSSVAIHRPWKPGETVCSFVWKTPKKEDSLMRSFITAFCSKYLEPDPATYPRDCSIYGDTWSRHAEAWSNPETHWTCSPWYHHRTHQTSKDKLKTQVVENFSNFSADMSRLGFYPTEYGIGIFTLYGGQWVRDALETMAQHLTVNGIPFSNEMSEAGWVTRFLIGADKETHIQLLGSY